MVGLFFHITAEYIMFGQYLLRIDFFFFFFDRQIKIVLKEKKVYI